MRALRLDDAQATQLLFPHWEIVRFLNARVPWPYPADGAESFYRDVALPGVARGEEWTWAIEEKGGPEHLIGTISLRLRGEENRGFWLGQTWQGRGLMTEASDAVTDFWFNVLDKDVLRVAKAIGNASSRRVSEKQGMRLVGIVERDYVSGRLATELWEISRSAWNERWAARVKPWRIEDVST
ncbi:MAG: GNAT family N-acetyltransferase [Hyphomicrobiaceae bacterium]|nr:GNAT family N-acetyltransferase [Hyphomicrobiaceae bacterium]